MESGRVPPFQGFGLVLAIFPVLLGCIIPCLSGGHSERAREAVRQHAWLAAALPAGRTTCRMPKPHARAAFRARLTGQAETFARLDRGRPWAGHQIF